MRKPINLFQFYFRNFLRFFCFRLFSMKNFWTADTPHAATPWQAFGLVQKFPPPVPYLRYDKGCGKYSKNHRTLTIRFTRTRDRNIYIELYEKFMRGRVGVLSTCEDVHALCGLIKLFLGQLGEPVLGRAHWHTLVRLARNWFPPSPTQHTSQQQGAPLLPPGPPSPSGTSTSTTLSAPPGSNTAVQPLSSIDTPSRYARYSNPVRFTVYILRPLNARNSQAE